MHNLLNITYESFYLGRSRARSPLLKALWEPSDSTTFSFITEIEYGLKKLDVIKITRKVFRTDRLTQVSTISINLNIGVKISLLWPLGFQENK